MSAAATAPGAPPPRRRARRSARLALAAALLAGLACRKAPEPAAAPPAAPPAAPAPESSDYRMADLAAAARLDARLQRVNALAGEYKSALTFDREGRLTEHTDAVALRLEEAVQALDRALDDVRDPRDRAHAGPLVAAARRWPGLLRAARAELVASPQPAGPAANALATTDEEVATALASYRAFRGGWRLVDAPEEPPSVLAFLRARRALEEAEAELGRRLGGAPPPAPPGAAPAGADAAARQRVEKAIAEAREAAAKIEDDRKAAARRFVDGEARALERLLALVAPTSDEQRGRDALDYQLAKVVALDALADFVEGAARRAAPAPGPSAAAR